MRRSTRGRGHPRSIATSQVSRYSQAQSRWGSAVSPPILDAELRRMGYDPEEILPLWAKVERLLKDGDRMTVTTKWQGKGVRMYVLQGLDGWASKAD